MMSLVQSAVLMQQQQLQQELDIQCVDSFSSALPTVEAWLMSSSDHQKALCYVGRRKNMDKYRCMLDFLLCEILPEHRRMCFRYYRGDGDLWCRLTTAEERARVEGILLRAILLAYVDFCTERKFSWTGLRVEALREAA